MHLFRQLTRTYSASLRSRARTWRSMILAGWLAILSPLQGIAATATIPEAQATAAYLALFTKYIEWPETERAVTTPDTPPPFTIGVLGHDPFDGALEQAFANVLVQGRPVVIKRVGSAAEARNCDLVFISREESRRQSLWLSELAGAPILTVTETETSLKPQAGVTLIREKTSVGSRLRFDVNLPTLQLARLKVSSSMLVSARRIVRATPERG